MSKFSCDSPFLLNSGNSSKDMHTSREVSKNLYTYAALLAFAAVGSYYGHVLATTYPNIRVWDIGNFALLLLGVPFLWLQSGAHLPNFWQKDIPSRYRIFFPLGVGLFFGLLDVMVFKLILHPEPYPELPPFLQPFPYSIFLYLSGAFEVEVFYRLIPITLVLLWGAHFKKGRYIDTFFWAAAILTSLREPLEQLSGGHWALLLYAFLSGFFMNLLQAIFYRKAGFLASISVRLGHYLLWHILLGVYVEFVELA